MPNANGSEKNIPKNLRITIIYATFALTIAKGTLAERLGNGLQNRVEQFDSARYLFYRM